MDYLKLSKIISLALRHTPEKYNMVLDEEGWGDVNTLLVNIANEHIEFNKIAYFDLVSAINLGDKKRHEINGQRIRALYGHSIKTSIKKEIVTPPNFLYHGTNSNDLKKIKIEGLKKMSRQYVHLSTDIEQAKKVALRKTSNPVILKINATDAVSAGLIFYKESTVWLCDFVPIAFIEIES